MVTNASISALVARPRCEGPGVGHDQPIGLDASLRQLGGHRTVALVEEHRPSIEARALLERKATLTGEEIVVELGIRPGHSAGALR